jgi:hypothetical protein
LLARMGYSYKGFLVLQLGNVRPSLFLKRLE